MAQEAPKKRVLNELRKRLRENQSEDGRLPPERQLASVLSVSRRAVREALAKLEGEGVVWRRQGQGTFTEAPPTVNYGEIAKLANRVNPLEVVDTRLAIEPMLAHRSALRASLADLEAMKRIAERALKAKTPASTRVQTPPFIARSRKRPETRYCWQCSKWSFRCAKRSTGNGCGVLFTT